MLLVAVLTPGHAQATPLKVVTGFSILEDLVRNVGGPRINLVNIVPADADTHTYQATTGDAQKLLGAKLIFVNGLGFDSWIEKLAKKISEPAKQAARIITVSEGLRPRQFKQNDQLENDPHMWWDIQNVRAYVKNIHAALVKADPVGRALFEANTSHYLKKLSQLETYTNAQMARIPTINRKFATDHDSFGYFAQRYQLNLIGTAMPGGTTSSEPSARDLARLSDAIKQAKVKAIFPENSINPKLAQALAIETGIKLAPALYTDSLGNKGSKGETFLKAFRYNVDTIVTVLK